MIVGLARRMLTEVDPRLLRRFVFGFGWKGMRAVQRFNRRVARGVQFPAFLFVSVTDRCNLRCRGCWVAPPPGEARDFDPDAIDRLIRAFKAQGAYSVGILGGEPFLHAGLLDLLSRHPDCYFIVFTNGTTLTAENAAEMHRLGNVTPLVSIEGGEHESDARRGGTNVYARALEGLGHCRQSRLVTGVATSVCRTNMADVMNASFVEEMISRGVHYLWYYLYRPVGPDPAPELALSTDEIQRLRRFIVDIRSKAPIVIVDAYWDHLGRALCPAATGIAYHVNAHGDVEPCPPIQLAVENACDGRDVYESIVGSQFLADFRRLASRTTRGCILLERPDLLRELAARHAARDSSGRGTVEAELGRMTPRPSHHLAGEEIPEAHWLYRFAKKHWFFGFGAYG